MSEYTPFKMKGSGLYGKGNQSPAKAHKPGHKKGTRKQDVTSKDYIIQDVSKVQENKKGKFITGLDDGTFSNNTSKDTTYLPPNMKSYSGKEYKKGDYMDETDFDERIGKKPKKKSPNKILGLAAMAGKALVGKAVGSMMNKKEE